MARFLLLHLKKPSNTKDQSLGNVLAMLRRMTNYLCREVSIPQVDRESMEEQLVKGLVRATNAKGLLDEIRGSYSIPTVEDDGYQGSFATEDWEQAIAATAVINHDLLERLLPDLGHGWWHRRVASSDALFVVAVQLGDDRLFDIFMGYLNALGKAAKRKAAGLWNFKVYGAMYRAVRTNHTRFVKELVQFLQNSGSPNGEKFLQQIPEHWDQAVKYRHCQVSSSAQSKGREGQLYSLLRGLSDGKPRDGQHTSERRRGRRTQWNLDDSSPLVLTKTR